MGFNKLVQIAAVAVLVAGCQPRLETEGNGGVSRPIDEQWGQFLAWWPGTYATKVTMETDDENFVANRSLHIRRVELPSFGAEVFYAEWQDADQPESILRQRLYAFEREEDTFRLNLHIFPPDPEFQARTAGAHLDPSKLDGVTPEDMFPLSGCDVFFKWEGSEFTGAMKKGACAFDAPETGVPIYSWSQMRLQADSFSYLDGWYRASDDTIYWQPSSQWFDFRKKAAER